jgi:hypothetical protein
LDGRPGVGGDVRPVIRRGAQDFSWGGLQLLRPSDAGTRDHGIGNAVSLVLAWIARLADARFALQVSRAEQGEQSPISQPAEGQAARFQHRRGQGGRLAPRQMSRSLAGLVRMDAHPAEIVPEARLHERVGRGVYRLARRTQYFVDNGWRCGLRFARADPLHLQSLTARCSLLTVGAGSSAGALALDCGSRPRQSDVSGLMPRLRIPPSGTGRRCRIRHVHHLLGNAIRFAFERIVD